VLGEADATLAWFDQIAASRSDALALPDLAHRLIPLLLSRDRWADASRLIDDGVEDLVRNHARLSAEQFPPELDEEFKKQIEEWRRDSLRWNAAHLRHMLIAGGRTEEAAAVERIALSLDSSDEMKQWLAKPRESLIAR
jgi:hypothetical protein